MNQQQGFTLIELMAAVLIVGILAAIAAPTIPARVSSNYNSINLTVGAAPATFTNTATPTSSRQTVDGTLTLDSSGVKNLGGKW